MENKKVTFNLKTVFDTDGQPLSHDERMLMANFNKLNHTHQKMLLNYFDDIAKAQKRGLPPPKYEPEHYIICSFCGIPAKQARRIIAGPNYTFICDKCIDICNKILKEEDIITLSYYKNILGKPKSPIDENGGNKIISNQEGDKLTFFYKNKKKRAEGKCISGLFEGKWLFYNTQGNLVQEGHFKNNEKNGAWKRFSKSGEITQQSIYKNGIKIK